MSIFPLCKMYRVQRIEIPCRGREWHVRVVIATDASNSGWGGSILAPFSGQVSDYWTEDQSHLEISTKEVIAIDKVLTSFSQQLRNGGRASGQQGSGRC